MSTWTSRCTLALLAGFGLSACADGIGVSRGTAPTSVTVTAADLVVAGPPGFCVDPSLQRDGGDAAVVVLGSCASIANAPRGRKPPVPAVLTASVAQTPTGPIDPDVLEGYFTSPAGRAALSRQDDPEAVEILEMSRAEQAIYIRARETTEGGPIAGTDDTYWRAIFGLDERLVSLSVVSVDGVPVSRDDGLRILRDFEARMVAENARRQPAPTALAPVPAAQPANTGFSRMGGFLRRLTGGTVG